MRLKNPKAKGDRLERQSRDLFRACGDLVSRSPGSLGVQDLLVIPRYLNSKKAVLVLVRANRWPSRADQKDALRLAENFDLSVVLHRWNDRNRAAPEVRKIR